jgi:MoaA/NifB/PqqE/SkfB family radical SAM enzyme
MPTSWWLSVIADAASAGVMVIEFTGGDPFVRQDAVELMAAADSMGIGLLINSDLSILRDEDVDRLSSLQNLVAVQTSLDGADEETCDQTRGRGGFKTLLRQLRQLKAAKLPVNVGTTVTTSNCSQVRAIAELAGAEGVDGMYIGPMYAAGRAVNLSSQLVGEPQWREACVQFAEAIVGGVVKPANYSWHRVAHALLDTGVNPVQDQPVMSSRGSHNLRIDPKGTAYVTAKLREFRRRYSSVGDLRSTSLRTVWRNSRMLNELRSYPVEPNVFDGIDIRTIPEDVDGVVHDDSRKDLS